jgi:hypothetical protein
MYSHIDVRPDRDQLIQRPDRASSMNKLVFDPGGEVLVEAVSKVRRRVAGASHQLLELSSVLQNGRVILPQDPELLLGVHRFVCCLETRFKLLPERLPAAIERDMPLFEDFHGRDCPHRCIALQEGKNGVDPLTVVAINSIPLGIHHVTGIGCNT